VGNVLTLAPKNRKAAAGLPHSKISQYFLAMILAGKLFRQAVFSLAISTAACFLPDPNGHGARVQSNSVHLLKE
jgi:hypothetical protein